MTGTPKPHTRLGCSTISFRHLPLDEALSWISTLGFAEIDLGALPGVCDHVPPELTPASINAIADTVAGSGLQVRSINGDIGDLNMSVRNGARAARDHHLDMLLRLGSAIGARALVLPCGALDHQPLRSVQEDLDRVASGLVEAAARATVYGIELWTESLHFHRLCWNIQRAHSLISRLAGTRVRVVMDFSHIVACGAHPVEFVDRFADRIAHVHIRDAVPGNINLSVGRGSVDFAQGLKALTDVGYSGHFALELETRDITDQERPAATAAAAQLISDLI
jgi:sugar phosphate isomerase/epimerase